MKYLFLCYIFLMIGLPKALHAQSVVQHPQALQKHHELTSYHLSEAQTLAYHKQARQKLKDMVDYVQFIVNAQHASERKLALQQLHKFFWEVPTWARSAQSIRQYTKDTKKKTLKSIKISKTLQPSNGLYQGKLSYQWGNQQETLDFTVRKITKKIGSRSIEVWKLFF